MGEAALISLMQIVIQPRIHIGLISLHLDAPRKNGGLGFAVNGPRATLRFFPSESFKIVDLRDRPLSCDEQKRLIRVLREVQSTLELKQAYKVEIQGRLATHVGMGSGTGIRLACLEALMRINGLPVAEEDIVRMSGRGGTSGIGINTYFRGGFVFDLGIQNDRRPILPSSLGIAPVAPLTLPWASLPTWQVCLCIPRSIPALTHEQEVEFFNGALPLSRSSSHEVCYQALFGVYSAISEQNQPAFSEAIEQMQMTEWKAREWSVHGDSLTGIRDSIRALGANFVGMSSLGPMMYAGGSEGFQSRLLEAADELDCEVLIVDMSSQGRQVFAS